MNTLCGQYSHHNLQHCTCGDNTSCSSTTNCSSKVACPISSNYNRRSSQRRRTGSSSALSAATDQHSLVSRLHEQAPVGGDGREVMSPAKGPPATKVLSAPRPVDRNASTTRHYSSQEAVRSRLAPYPSTCTWPSPVEGRGSQDRWRAISQMDIETTTDETQVAPCHGRQRSGSTLVRAQPQSQRCGDQRVLCQPDSLRSRSPLCRG